MPVFNSPVQRYFDQVGTINHNTNTATNNNTNNHIYLHHEANKSEFDQWQRQIGSLLLIPDEYLSIKPFVDLIVAALQPERIFLYRHPGLDEYGILPCNEVVVIVKDDDQKSSIKVFKSLHRLSCFKDKDVFLSIHTSFNLDRGLRDGHPYYSIICTEQNLIFSGSPYRLLKTEQSILSEKKMELRDKITSEFKNVSFLMDKANECIGKGEQNLAAMMLHQVVEGIYNTIRHFFSDYATFSSRHNLKKLQKRASKYFPYLFESMMFESSLYHLNMTYKCLVTPHFDITEIEDIPELHRDIDILFKVSSTVLDHRIELLECDLKEELNVKTDEPIANP